MRVIILLSIIIFCSCNGAKRIQRIKAQFDEIGRDWAQSHPCPPAIAKSDTTYLVDSTEYFKYIGIINDLSTGSDLQTDAQLRLERELYLKDENYKRLVDSLAKHPIVISKKIIIHDSIPDTRALRALQDQLQTKDVELSAKQGEKDQLKKTLRGWIAATLILGVLISLAIGIKLAGVFSPKLKI